ncbi:hypothetical protein IHE45_07G057000 [Dioscorea alata]|uniref:Uncharacterized protein n=1 Tax=Dioscorea alata TaxID=55571 RepID=A0ACB7VRR6_DIOAL|nr:hypothetical protein IHE45_07G057000 [Dioscorea alata]
MHCQFISHIQISSLEENFKHSDADVINNEMEEKHESSCPINDSGFDDDHQAVGDNSTYFILFLGQIVRNRSFYPLQVQEWKDVQNDSIEHMRCIILVNSMITYYFSN